MVRLALVMTVTFLIAILLTSCGSSKVTQNLSAEERFELGKSKFDDEDYLEAISEFEIVRLQFPGSGVADKAQYYLGESRFQLEEYLMAAQEYQALRRNFPASDLVPIAQYKIGLCYYNLSPKSSLDQAYTARALDELQTFVEYYPKHEFVRDAETKIADLNNRLSKKLFDTAELYMKMEYFRSATIYYGLVTEKYHDTPYAEPAQMGKIRSLIARKRYAEAKPEVEKYLQKYPDGNHRGEAESLLRRIEERLKTKSAAIAPEILPTGYPTT